jgi:hypothetical protein
LPLCFTLNALDPPCLSAIVGDAEYALENLRGDHLAVGDLRTHSPAVAKPAHWQFPTMANEG